MSDAIRNATGRDWLASQSCPKCGRSDCGLMADVIIGERNYRAAVADCVGYQRRPVDGQAYVGTGHPR